MKHRLITNWLKFLNKLTGKKFLYINPNHHNGLGKTAVWCDFGFWYVGNVYDTSDMAYSIAQNGAIEPQESQLVDNLLAQLVQAKSQDDRLVFYDIGANTGFYGVLAAKKHGAIVEAFEPVTAHIDCIQETCRLNNLSSIHIHTMGLGAKSDRLSITLAGSGSSLRSGFLGTQSYPTSTVPVEPLDTLQLAAPDFIMMDVEGYEWEVLQGAHKTIANAKPICFMEIAKTFHSRDIKNERFDDTIQFFTDLGYTVYLHHDNKLLPMPATPIPDGTQMYLFLPPDTVVRV